MSQASLFSQTKPRPLIVCNDDQWSWAVRLGVPVFASPVGSPVSSFEEQRWDRSRRLLEDPMQIVKTAWDTGVPRIIHIGALTLLENSLSSDGLSVLVSSVALSAIAAKTLRVPFVYLSPTGRTGVPAGDRGIQALTAEDQAEEAWIVHANAPFGPDLDNQAKRWVRSEKLTVDDQRPVNPVSQEALEGLIRSGEGEGDVYAGGPQTTWYDFFLEAEINTVLPWNDPLGNPKVREHSFEWKSSEPSHMRQFRNWYSHERN